MRRLLTALVPAALLSGILDIAGLDQAGAAPPPPAGGYFSRLPAGSTLPSEASCAAAVHSSSWEPRPENDSANHTAPTSAQLASFQSQDLEDFDAVANSTYKSRVNGSFFGTTDELIQFY